jgi:hypothetical protein
MQIAVSTAGGYGFVLSSKRRHKIVGRVDLRDA